MKSKPLSEIWWIAIDPADCPIWSYLELRKCDVIERLSTDILAWKSRGWRVAKLQVNEI